MKRLILFLSFIAFSHSVFAASKIEQCEKALAAKPRKIQITPNVPVELSDSQILIRGNLTFKQSPEVENQVYWLVTDSFLAREVMPEMTNSTRQLSDGDQIFFLDDHGDVAFSGYYGEQNFQPALYRDAKLRYLMLETDRLKALFYSRHQAVAIVNLNSVERHLLDWSVKIWFPLYQQHQTSDKRTLRVGSKVLETHHFEISSQGKISATFYYLEDVSLADREAHGPDRLYKLSLIFEDESGGRRLVQEGDRFFLVDAQGEPLDELVVGSESVPLLGTLAQIRRIADQLQTARPAVLFQNPVIRR